MAIHMYQYTLCNTPAVILCQCPSNLQALLQDRTSKAEQRAQATENQAREVNTALSSQREQIVWLHFVLVLYAICLR